MNQFAVVGISQVILEGKEGDNKSQHVSTDILMEMSPNMNRELYQDKKGNLNKEGAKCLTTAFVQGLVANIHACHQSGAWDSAEHLRYIISKLEEGFVLNATITKVEH